MSGLRLPANEIIVGPAPGSIRWHDIEIEYDDGTVVPGEFIHELWLRGHLVCRCLPNPESPEYTHEYAPYIPGARKKPT